MKIFFYIKTILILSILILQSEIYAINLWTRINSPVSTSLFNCTFPDTLNGWAAGESGIIIHSSDGGNSFSVQNTPVNFYTNDIFFCNKRLGWAVANENFFSGSTFLKTTNGGVNWMSFKFPDSNKVIRSVYFLDSLNGFCGSFTGNIYKTTNSGFTWNESVVDSGVFNIYPISEIKFISHDTGFACGGQLDIAGVIWKTTDGGMHWKAGVYSPEPFYDLYFLNSENVIAAGGDFEYGVQISRTSDCGLNWNYHSLGIFGQARSIDFRTSAEAWMALAFARTFAVSYDSGYTWTSVPATDSSELNCVVFADSLHGWAVGNNGVILKYNKSLVSIQSSQVNSISENFTLNQNYPNPFNPVTKIIYSLAENSFIKLKIYNVSGSLVSEMYNGFQTAGKHSITFNGSEFTSGVYFYKLEVSLPDSKESGKFSDTKKMLLLK